MVSMHLTRAPERLFICNRKLAFFDPSGQMPRTDEVTFTQVIAYL